MQDSQPNLFARDDTMFGVCEALGEDFGFNPLYLRVTLAVLLFWNPIAVFGAYAAAGAVVALTRWLIPNPRPAVRMESVAEQANDQAEPDLAIAA